MLCPPITTTTTLKTTLKANRQTDLKTHNNIIHFILVIIRRSRLLRLLPLRSSPR